MERSDRWPPGGVGLSICPRFECLSREGLSGLRTRQRDPAPPLGEGLSGLRKRQRDPAHLLEIQMNNEQIESRRANLTKAVEHASGVPGVWAGVLEVILKHEYDIVWQGPVHLYRLTDHPDAKVCYAWDSEADDGTVRFYAVLEISPVNSPTTAVQAAIAADHHAGRKP